MNFKPEPDGALALPDDVAGTKVVEFVDSEIHGVANLEFRLGFDFDATRRNIAHRAVEGLAALIVDRSAKKSPAAPIFPMFFALNHLTEPLLCCLYVTLRFDRLQMLTSHDKILHRRAVSKR